MRLPAFGRISQGFSATHPALDIAGGLGTPILAPHDGKVTYAGQAGSGTSDCGLAIDIVGDRYHSRLCHNQTINVQVGQIVSEGQQVGTQGYTGYTQPDNVPEGAHCHWVLWDNGTKVDGRNYIKQGEPKMTNIQFDTFIAETYMKIAGRKPSDAEFNFHRQQYAAQGDKWCLEMVKGFKGDDWAWPVYERNLKDASAKIEALSKEGTPLAPGKYVVK